MSGCVVWWVVEVFFFKQKTAYEMRIRDWSSDVCSSDLLDHPDVEAEPVQSDCQAGPDQAAADDHHVMSCLHGAMIERMTRSNPAAASSLEWTLSARRARSCPPHEHQPATRHRPAPDCTADGGAADARRQPLHDGT